MEGQRHQASTIWFDTPGFFASETTTSGTFVGIGAEVWRFKTPELILNNASPTFRFTVFYRHLVTGETFWDNNLGQDYRVSKSDGALVEFLTVYPRRRDRP